MRLDRTAVWVAFSALFLGGTGCGVFGSPPDVFLLTLDGVRVDHLGSYGARGGATPRLDEFAASAAVFSNAWSTSCATVPAIASIVTGRYPTSHGATTETAGVPDTVTTLAETLAARGYHTAAFRSGSVVPTANGLFQGYRTRDVEPTDPRRADGLTDAALAWLRTIPPDQRVHALISYGDLSSPSRSDRDGIDAGAVNRGTAPSAAMIGRERERYAAALRFGDEHIGRLLEGLRAAGRFEQALIIVAGTHGEALGEHALAGHGLALYEDVLHVPFLVHYPGSGSDGAIVEAATSLVDLFPLVLDEVGVPVPDGVEGTRIGERDVVVAECARDPAAVSAYGARFDRDLFAVIRWPWKLIASDRDPPELYQLNAPTKEQDNRYGTVPGVQVDLLGTLERARTAMRPPSS